MRIVQNPIGILACRYLLHDRVRLQVEDDDRISAAIADGAPVEIIGNRNPMGALHAAIFPTGFSEARSTMSTSVPWDT